MEFRAALRRISPGRSGHPDAAELTSCSEPTTLAGQTMTTANKISIFRILLVPLFIVQVLYYVEEGIEYHRLLAVLCFGIAAISDGVDGYLARHYNQRSEL